LNTLYTEILDADLEVFKNMIQNRMFDDVIIIVEDAIKQNPNYTKIDELYYLCAEAYYGLDKYELALKNYLIIIENYPTTKLLDKVLYKIGEVNFRLKKDDETIKYLKEFLKKFPDNELSNRAYYFLGETLIRKTRYKEAIVFLEALANKYDDELYFNANYSMGWAYLSLGEYEKAINYYKRIEGKKDFEDVNIQIGECYLKLNDLEKAEKYFLKIPANSSDYINALYSLSAIYLKQKKEGKVEQIINELNDKYTNDYLTLAANFDYANYLYESEKYEQSLKYFEAVNNIRIKNINEEIASIYETANYFTGYIYQILFLRNKENKNNFNNAERNYKKYLENYKSGKYRERALFRLGEIYAENNDIENSIRYYNQVQDKNLLDKALFEIARQLYLQNKKDEGIKYLVRLIKETPESKLIIETYFLIAEYYFEKKDYSNSINYYDELIKVGKNKNSFYEDALYKKGWALSELAKYEEAVKVFDLLLNEFPESKYRTSIQFQISKIYFDKKDYENSEKYLIAIKPENNDDLIKKNNNLGVIKITEAELFESKKEFGKAISLYNAAAEYYEKANNIDDYISSKIKEADLHFKINSFNEVIKIYNDLISKYSENKNVIYFYHGLGWAYYKINDLKNSINSFLKFIEKYEQLKEISVRDSSLLEEALVLLGESYYTIKDLKNSEYYYSEYIKRFPAGKYVNDIKIRQSKIIAANKSPEEALKLLLDEYARTPVSPQRRELTFNICLTFFELNNWSEYLKWSQLYIDNYKTENIEHIKIIRYNQIISFYKLNKNEEAENLAIQFINDFPDFEKNDQLYFLIGTIKFNNKLYSESIKVLVKIISEYTKSDKYEDALYLISLSCYNLKSYKQAIEYIEQINLLYPQSKFKKSLNFYKLSSYKELQQWNEVLKFADEIINNEEDELNKIIEIYYKAEALYNIGRYNETIEIANEGIKKYSEAEKEGRIKDNDIIAALFYLLGETYQRLDKLAYSILQYNRIINVYPFENYVDKAMLALANVNIKMGRVEIAKNLLEKFLIDFGSSELRSEAERLLETLK